MDKIMPMRRGIYADLTLLALRNHALTVANYYELRRL